MTSIYPQLKKSDRKFIRTEKARIRRQFSDSKKQQELINDLYKKMVGESKVAPKNTPTHKEVKKEETKKVKKNIKD